MTETHIRPRVAVLLLLTMLTLGMQAPAMATTDSAVDSTSATTTDDPAAEDPITDPPVEALEGQSSSYVLANSEEEAAAILDALASGSTSINAGVEYGPCVLYPSVVYLRKSSNYSAVGTKPYTKCSVWVEQIHHETTLKYKWGVWWRSKGPWKGTTYGSSTYTSLNVEYTCRSTEATTWAGTTWGRILYRGNNYYARVYQAQARLNCGA